MQCTSDSVIVPNKVYRYILIGAGTLFLALGVVGIFIPLLPTTPFLLLAAACYARGSDRFYHWLMNNKYLGSYIKNYLERKGIPLKIKLIVLTLLWVTILASLYFIVNNVWIEIILLVIALGVTIHILTIKTYKKKCS